MKELLQCSIIEVIIKPRATYMGMPCKPAVMALVGQRRKLEVMWKMDEADKYPGEYALGDGRPECQPDENNRLFAVAGIAWIASGDVEILSVIEQGI